MSRPSSSETDCCAAATRRLHGLSIEVLSAYQLAEIANITGGFNVGTRELAETAP